jgi:hypothetical protein
LATSSPGAKKPREVIRESGDRCGGQRKATRPSDLASNAPPDPDPPRGADPITDAVITWVVEIGVAITKAVR